MFGALFPLEIQIIEFDSINGINRIAHLTTDMKWNSKSGSFVNPYKISIEPKFHTPFPLGIQLQFFRWQCQFHAIKKSSNKNAKLKYLMQKKYQNSG